MWKLVWLHAAEWRLSDNVLFRRVRSSECSKIQWICEFGG